ncbi:MAG: peptide ABC transporter substrate-binding protein [Gammaproteobacteria bacterium]|nr:peptide ABC transporter substrate-binding protein [Gammaproteobacteria bacterium]
MKAGIGMLLAATALLLSSAANAAELRIGNGGEPLTLDPHRYNLNLEEKILADLFEGLTAHDAEGRIVPGVAEGWTTSADGLTWTFQLRRDARWSDGEPVTAADFVFSFRRLLDPATAASLAYFLYAIEGAADVNAGRTSPDTLAVRALGTHFLEIRLAEPFPFFAERLIYPTGYPVPRHIVEELGDDWVKPGNMVTNGAFVLADWQPQGFVRVVANPHYRDATNVGLEALTYYPTADPNAAYNRYRSGELDIIGDFPPGEVAWLRREMPEHLHISPLLSIMYLVFNVSEPPFDDVRVRRALSLAIDRELITGRVLESGEVPSTSFVPPMVENYASAVRDRSVDADAARRLLAEAGYHDDNPLRVTLRYIAGADSKKVQVAIAAMWKAIGVETALHHAELNAHFAELRQGNFQVAQAGWFGENNPEHYLELLMSSTGDVNYGRFADTEVDALMTEAKRTADLDQRLALLRRAEAAALALDPVVPLYAVTIRSLVDPRITGWRTNARNTHPARYLDIRR